jgi:hypothetical protein
MIPSVKNWLDVMAVGLQYKTYPNFESKVGRSLFERGRCSDIRLAAVVAAVNFCHDYRDKLPNVSASTVSETAPLGSPSLDVILALGLRLAFGLGTPEESDLPSKLNWDTFSEALMIAQSRPTSYWLDF